MIREAFADTSFFVALLDRKDKYHASAVQLHLLTKGIVTSDFVLIELLNFFSEHGTYFRQAALHLALSVRSRPDIKVAPCSRELYDEALSLYARRPDKDWSLTDCSSFGVMRALGITAALTADKHFTQAGMTALLLD